MSDDDHGGLWLGHRFPARVGAGLVLQREVLREWEEMEQILWPHFTIPWGKPGTHGGQEDTHKALALKFDS